ncbi:MAG: ClbS/DfsB family four-helix bundle protein [Candidatus Heimdallarchaeota archaeon]
MGKWSVKDVLSHIAGWDIWMSTTIQTILGGNQLNLSAPLDVDVTNAKFVEDRVRWSIDQILTEMADTLQKVLYIVGGLSEEQIFKPQLFEGHDCSIYHLLKVGYEHDRRHTDKILLRRKSQKIG